MIGYIEGKLIRKGNERIMVLAGGVGYEVMLPAFVMETVAPKEIGETVSLHIYFHQTERQPKPVLIGPISGSTPGGSCSLASCRRAKTSCRAK